MRISNALRRLVAKKLTSKKGEELHFDQCGEKGAQQLCAKLRTGDRVILKTVASLRSMALVHPVTQTEAILDSRLFFH